MQETSRSLLERLRLQPDPGSWRRLVDLYTPLIQRWLRQCGVPAGEVDDLVQDVLGIVVRKMPDFQHSQQRGAFRHWLRAIAVNRTKEFWRSRRTLLLAGGDTDVDGCLEQLEDPHSDLNRLWEQEHDKFIAARLLELIEPEFTQTTWLAFRRQVLDGAKASAVAAELGITPNAASIAKSRVLRRLREEIAGLTDE